MYDHPSSSTAMNLFGYTPGFDSGNDTPQALLRQPKHVVHDRATAATEQVELNLAFYESERSVGGLAILTRVPSRSAECQNKCTLGHYLATQIRSLYQSWTIQSHPTQQVRSVSPPLSTFTLKRETSLRTCQAPLRSE